MRDLTGASIPEMRDYFRKSLQAAGTNVEQNDRDPYGDGDQSSCTERTEKDRQFYRDLFGSGGEINDLIAMGMSTMSDFAQMCISGCSERVEQALKAAAAADEEDDTHVASLQTRHKFPGTKLMQLIERRETSLRLSPLLMIVSMGKNIQASGLAAKQIKVAKLLLEYGARVDARDVCGKTVCHYGMGAMATEMTLTIGKLCLEAYPSSHLCGKVVELHSLKTAALNGTQGLCKGHVVTDKTNRRGVFLFETKATKAFKAENLKLVDCTDGESERNLCDIPDRLGTVCLHEVVTADRLDVAKILLNEYSANVHISDGEDMTPLAMAVAQCSFSSETAQLVKKAAAAASRKEQKEELRKCASCACQLVPPFKACARCQKVNYCSRECQVAHYKAHKSFCKIAAAEAEVAILLESPTEELYTATVPRGGTLSKLKPCSLQEGFIKPGNVRVNEKFDIKVQANGPTAALCIYDKSREFNTYYYPGKPGFQELFQAVRAEPTWQGRKTFVEASFDAQGNCTVYPGKRSIRKW